MRFGLLGLLQAEDGAGNARPVAGARQRVLLAALLVRVNRVVPADELAEIVWDGAPPTGAAALRTQVMRLRHALGPDATARITAREPGYMITLSADELDISLFEALHEQAGAAMRAGRWGEAARVLGQALALWRGAVLLDVGSQVLRDECGERLEQLRVQAMEWQAEAGMALGRHEQLVPQLRDLARQHPLREHNHAQLMLALYRCGRQAEALAAYQRAREILVSELGVEPGPGLRDLHQRILSADPALAVSGPVLSAEAEPQREVPRELPASPLGFTGRSAELRALTGLLERSGEHAPGAVVISAIGGTAGVGKTALAVHWAHQVAPRFPDGQLYVNLRGYDPDQPVPSADALAGLLRSLGVPGQDIPPEEDQRAGRYRSLLAGKRMLVVLDNAGSADQVRPLLPGNPACTVVVTSRDALAGLVARDGAARLDLDVLPMEEAVGLLRVLIGPRVDADPCAAADLAEHCCRLPLALRVAAEHAVARPRTSLVGLADELSGQQRRLDLLDAGGDPRTAVRAVFSWSCRHLDADTARAFRLASLHPAADFDPYAVAALTGATLEQAHGALDVLGRAHLIQRAGPDRYGMHDLLRAYARELAEARGADEEARAALTRLFDHYLHTAANAMDTLYPAERHRRPSIPSPATPAPPVTDPAVALAWLDAERAAMAAVTAHTSGHGWPAHTTRLAAILYRYLAGGHYPEAITVYTHARDAARRIGDCAAEATALNHLASFHCQQGRYQQATGNLEQVLKLLQQTGDRTGQAHALGNLGNVCVDQGRYQSASSLYEQALRVFRQAGDQVGEARMLGNLGNVEERQGRYQQAARHLQQCLDIARETGSRPDECSALTNLGTVGLRQGHYHLAAGHLERALALCREIGYRFCEVEALIRIGDVCLRQDRPQEAAVHLQSALAQCQEMGQRFGETDALNSLGEVLLATGQPGDALTRHTIALGLAGQIGDKYQQARACKGLGDACDATADPAQSRHHWHKALALYTELGCPEAREIRARLARAGNNRDDSAETAEENGGATAPSPR